MIKRIRERRRCIRHMPSDEETKRLIAQDKAEHPEDFKNYECRDLTKEEFAKLVKGLSARIIAPLDRWL